MSPACPGRRVAAEVLVQLLNAGKRQVSAGASTAQDLVLVRDARRVAGRGGDAFVGVPEAGTIGRFPIRRAFPFQCLDKMTWFPTSAGGLADLLSVIVGFGLIASVTIAFARFSQSISDLLIAQGVRPFLSVYGHCKFHRSRVASNFTRGLASELSISVGFCVRPAGRARRGRRFRPPARGRVLRQLWALLGEPPPVYAKKALTSAPRHIRRPPLGGMVVSPAMAALPHRETDRRRKCPHPSLARHCRPALAVR